MGEPHMHTQQFVLQMFFFSINLVSPKFLPFILFKALKGNQII